MVRFLIALVVFLASATQSHALDFKVLARGIISMHLRPTPAPPVVPLPTPSGVCENCNGKGKVGDGTVFVECPVCEGTGKPKTEVAPVVTKKNASNCADGSCGLPQRRGLLDRILR